MRGWRRLGLFWLGVLVVAGASGAALQVLGPPGPLGSKAAATSEHGPAQHGAPEHGAPGQGAPEQAADPHPAPSADHERPPVTPLEHDTSAHDDPIPGQPSPAPKTAGQIADPDPALLEPAPDFPGAKLPRIAANGRTPMQVYARLANPADTRPKVAMLLVGFGLSDAESRTAIDTLPPGVTLGVSPYTREPDALLADARAHGHEILVTLPMESQGYPLNDSGPHALLTGAEPADNSRNLEWVLSRIAGAAGVSGASDGLRGERFATMAAAMTPVLQELRKRGLLYVDPHPNATVTGATVAITTIIDDPPLRASIDMQLAELEQRARDGKAAVGLAGPLRPVTVEHIANWARGLDGRGIALVSVSAMLPRSAPK